MKEEFADNLEMQIHDLLNGGLDEPDRVRLLERVAHDDRARQALCQAVELRREARAAFGYDQADALAKDALPRLKSALAAGKTTLATPPRAPARANRFRFLWRASTLARVAAVVVVVASMYVAVVVNLANRELRANLSRSTEPAGLPGLTEGELADLRTVWNGLLDRSQDAQPWVLLSNGSGQFGYVPAGKDGADSERLVLVRCMLVNEANKSISEVNLLLPAQQDLRLSVPDAGKAGNRPINCDVWVAGRWAGLSLSVGDKAKEVSGLAGRANIGGKPVEIGQFLLDGSRLRVILQALPLTASAS